MTIAKQWLFFDRTDLSTGTSRYRFQENRMSREGKQKAEELHGFWNFCMDIGDDHGLSPLRMPSGLRFEPEQARVTAPILPLELPWEQGRLGYLSAAYDDADGWYKLWYTVNCGDHVPALCFADGEAFPGRTLTLFARSRDTVTWEKPGLGIVTCGGEDTNAVNISIGEGSVFLDPLHPETGRIKAVNAATEDDPTKSPAERVNLFFYTSEDGYHFRRLDAEPLHYFFDTQNNVFYDEPLGKYTAYLRGHFNGRAIQRAEAEDLRKLPMPELLLWPDNEDPLDADYYNNACTPYPHDPTIRLMFPSIYYHGTDALDVRMAYSRNGRQFQWVSRQPVIGNRDEAGTVLPSVYASPHMLPLGDQVGMILRTSTALHNEGYFASLYRDWDPSGEGIRMAVWQKDRLCGLKAEETGELWLQMKLFPGARLQLNGRAKGQGCIRCQLVTQREDRPLGGCTLEDCAPFTGDFPWADIRWRNVTDLPVPEDGRDVFLHIRLERAKLFGVRLCAPSEMESRETGERIVSAHL